MAAWPALATAMLETKSPTQLAQAKTVAPKNSSEMPAIFANASMIKTKCSAAKCIQTMELIKASIAIGSEAAFGPSFSNCNLMPVTTEQPAEMHKIQKYGEPGKLSRNMAVADPGAARKNKGAKNANAVVYPLPNRPSRMTGIVKDMTRKIGVVIGANAFCDGVMSSHCASDMAQANAPSSKPSAGPNRNIFGFFLRGKSAPLLSSGPPFCEAKSNSGTSRVRDFFFLLLFSSSPSKVKTGAESSSSSSSSMPSSLNTAKTMYAAYAEASNVVCHNAITPLIIIAKTVRIPIKYAYTSLLYGAAETRTPVNDPSEAFFVLSIKMTTPKMTVVMNKPEPNAVETAISTSGMVPDVTAATCAKTSGAPFPSANNVAPATSGEIFKIVATVSSAGQKNASATSASAYKETPKPNA
mmetsp:Transcript_257/g.793  ORF Transcript_257/g.793 Transcript_257/m.793 type:complete len:412 (+) Transcript_257:395-1630(+)